MPHRCPWYLGYFLINPLRKLRQHPARLLAPFVGTGFRVLEPGPGMGYFTLELARLVGPTGKVHVIDIEPRMLAALERHRTGHGRAADRQRTLASAVGERGVEPVAEAADLRRAIAVDHDALGVAAVAFGVLEPLCERGQPADHVLAQRRLVVVGARGGPGGAGRDLLEQIGKVGED